MDDYGEGQKQKQLVVILQRRSTGEEDKRCKRIRVNDNAGVDKDRQWLPLHLSEDCHETWGDMVQVTFHTHAERLINWASLYHYQDYYQVRSRL